MTNLEKLQYRKIAKAHLHKYTHIFLERDGYAFGINALATPYKSILYNLTEYNAFWCAPCQRLILHPYRICSQISEQEILDSLLTNNKQIEILKQSISKRINSVMKTK